MAKMHIDLIRQLKMSHTNRIINNDNGMGINCSQQKKKKKIFWLQNGQLEANNWIDRTNRWKYPQICVGC